jgi:lysozyme
MSRHISDEGLSKIKQYEGLRLKSYKDVGGVWTIGYGNTRHAKPNMEISNQQADLFLREDIATFEQAVERLVKVPLNDNQFAALVSFSFNVGSGALEKSTLLKKLNAGDYECVPNELLKWNKVQGKAVTGLTNRRNAEGGLWVKGQPVSSQYVEPETPQGKVPVQQKVGFAITSVATVASTAAEQLAPISDTSSTIKGLFVGLIVIGVLVTMYSSLTKAKEESA